MTAKPIANLHTITALHITETITSVLRLMSITIITLWTYFNLAYNYYFFSTMFWIRYIISVLKFSTLFMTLNSRLPSYIPLNILIRKWGESESYTYISIDGVCGYYYGPQILSKHIAHTDKTILRHYSYFMWCRWQYRCDQRRTGYVRQQKGVVFSTSGSDTAYPAPFDVRPSSIILSWPTRERLWDVRPFTFYGRQVGKKFTVFCISSVQRPGENFVQYQCIKYVNSYLLKNSKIRDQNIYKYILSYSLNFFSMIRKRSFFYFIILYYYRWYS